MSADETTVAVCTENLFCHLFDTRAFFDKTPHPVGPYFTVRLASSPEIVLRDFAFNPVIPNMFAVVMSDGKVTNYEVACSNGHFTLKIHGSYAGGKCCECFSELSTLQSFGALESGLWEKKQGKPTISDGIHHYEMIRRRRRERWGFQLIYRLMVSEREATRRS